MAFKRNGKVVGTPQPKFSEHSDTMEIAKLLPLEGAVVEPRLEGYRTKIKNGEVIEPPKVVPMGEEFLVVNGNNRVYAAKLEGKTAIEVRVVNSDNATFHSREAAHARRRCRLGFNAITVVSSDEEREKFTTAEAKENESAWIDTLSPKEGG